MGGSTSSGSSTQMAVVPAYMKPLYKQSAKNIQDYQNLDPLSNYSSPKPLRIAPLTESEQEARRRVMGGALTDRPEGESLAYQALNRIPGLASRRVTGESVRDDPAIKAALDAYALNTEPGLVNQVKLMGLGNSTAVANALGRGRADLLTPLIMASQGREERAIDRELGATEGTINPYLALGGRERGATAEEIARMEQQGAIERGVEQDEYNAELRDYLRRQGLSEQALYAAFNKVPSTIGSIGSTQTSGGGMK